MKQKNIEGPILHLPMTAEVHLSEGSIELLPRPPCYIYIAFDALKALEYKFWLLVGKPRQKCPPKVRYLRVKHHFFANHQPPFYLIRFLVY